MYLFKCVCMSARVCADIHVLRAAEAVARLPGSEEQLLAVLEEQEEKNGRRRREARMEQERAQVPVGRKPGLQLQPASVRCPFGGL